MKRLNELNELVLKELIYHYYRKILEAENENLAELKAIQRYLVSIHIEIGKLITLLDSIIERKMKEHDEDKSLE